MSKKIFNTSKAPRMSDVFPQAVIANNLIFLSGTPGLDLSTGKVVSDNFEVDFILFHPILSAAKDPSQCSGVKSLRVTRGFFALFIL